MTNRITQLEKKIKNLAFPKKVGTQIFNYKERCVSCGKIKMVDINGECKSCEKEMREFRGIK